jgi:hypothetical protein
VEAGLLVPVVPVTGFPSSKVVYLQQNKKRRKPRVKSVTLKLWGIRKMRYSAIDLIYKEPLMSRLGRNPRRKNEGRN